MPNIGDSLPFCIRVAASVGAIDKGIHKMFVASSVGAIDREVRGVFVAPAVGAITKRVNVGAGRLGDVNNDGVIDITDYTLISLHYLGNRTLTADEFYRADVNQDGVIDEADSNMVRDYILADGA